MPIIEMVSGVKKLMTAHSILSAIIESITLISLARFKAWSAKSVVGFSVAARIAASFINAKEEANIIFYFKGKTLFVQWLHLASEEAGVSTRVCGANATINKRSRHPMGDLVFNKSNHATGGALALVSFRLLTDCFHCEQPLTNLKHFLLPF